MIVLERFEGEDRCLKNMIDDLVWKGNEWIGFSVEAVQRELGQRLHDGMHAAERSLSVET